MPKKGKTIEDWLVKKGQELNGLTDELPKKEVSILTCLLVNGPNIAYRIAHNSGVRQNTIYVTLSRLEKKQMVSSRKLRGKRQTKGERQYKLTIRGLVQAFTTEDGLLALVNWKPIVDNWGYLAPLILERWEIFVSNGLASEAVRRLYRASTWLLELLRPSFWKYVSIEEPPETFMDEEGGRTLAEFFYGPGKWVNELFESRYFEKRLFESLYPLVAKDAELRTFIVQRLSDVLADLRMTEKGIEALRRIF